MPNMFATLAKKATTLSPLMDGRDKMSTKDVIEQYPDGITVIGFDLITTTDNNGNANTYPIIVFEEDAKKFIYGGKALNDICTLWVGHFEGDIDACSAALAAAGGVKIKLASGTTKQGRSFTSVEVIG